jgi:hypothetical protein
MGPDMGTVGETAIDWYGYVPNAAASIALLSILGCLTLANLARNTVTPINLMPIVHCSMSESTSEHLNWNMLLTTR